ncbi:MAG: hypothetical protein RLY30_466 [Pseudomonadota bacterium]
MKEKLRACAPALHYTAIAVAVLSTFGAARAQQAPSPASNKATAAEPQTLVVTGFRASVESALASKREDNGMVDVIKAEDIAKFPDTNLAESLQRVPGVTIDRDAGEGRQISVRGLGPDFTRVRINGVEALSTTGGTDSSGGTNRTRGFDFNVFASELFNSVTVRKSSSADVEEGSLGATVDLRAARPFDYKGRVGAVSAEMTYNDLSGTSTPRASFLLSNTSADRKMGFLISGAVSKRKIYEDQFDTVLSTTGNSNGGYCKPSTDPLKPSTCANGAVGLPGTTDYLAAYNAANAATNYAPRLPRYGRFTHDQTRAGLTAAFQMRPVEGGLLTAELLYAKLDATREENWLESLSLSRSATQGGKPEVSVMSASFNPSGSLLYGKFNNVDLRAEARLDEFSTTFTQPTLTWEQEISDNLTVKAMVGRAKSKFENPVQTTLSIDALNTQNYVLDYTKSTTEPLISYGIDVSNPANWSVIGAKSNVDSSIVRMRPQGTDNTLSVKSIDVDWVLSKEFTVKAGLNNKDFENVSYEQRRKTDYILGLPAGITLGEVTRVISGFGSKLDMPAGSATSWVVPDFEKFMKAMNAECNCLQSGAAGGAGDFTLSAANITASNYSVNESDSGAYLMGEFKGSWFGFPTRGNVGVRRVTTEISTTGIVSGKPVTVSHEYSDTLPAFNIAADLSTDLVMRFATAKVMARPGLGAMYPGGSVSVSGGANTVSTGNPFLDPYRAKTMDVSLEYYHGKGAYVGLGVFRKRLDSWIQRLRQTMPYSETGLPLSLLPTNFNGTEEFQVTTFVNGEGGTLKGFEFNVQQPFTMLPGALRNTGVLFNYTHASSKIKYLTSPTNPTPIEAEMTGLSPKSMNLTLYYDDGKASARMSATKRDAFLTAVPGAQLNDVEGKRGSLAVDFASSYKLSDTTEVSFDGINLRNTPDHKYGGSTRLDTRTYAVTGRTFMIGVRHKF